MRLGYEFDVNITSTVFMIKDTTNNHEIITTYPGQGITANSFTSYSFYNTAISDISKYITVSLDHLSKSSFLSKVLLKPCVEF